jgi:hypothetical protein
MQSWAWTQGLLLEPFHQPYLCEGFFWDRVSWAVCPGWVWTSILLIYASWVARLTGGSHRRLAVLGSLRTAFALTTTPCEHALMCVCQQTSENQDPRFRFSQWLLSWLLYHAFQSQLLELSDFFCWFEGEKKVMSLVSFSDPTWGP